MRIQGWGISTASAPGIECAVQSGFRLKKPRMPAAVDEKTPPSQSDPSRSELLDAIKRRIKSGFYSSESVIDDLGDSFAQALDQTL